jgi:tight adherence protein B
MPNLAADPLTLVFVIAGAVALIVFLIGLALFTAVNGPRAKLKRRMNAVIGEDTLAMSGEGRDAARSGARRKKQLQQKLKAAETSRDGRKGFTLRDKMVHAGLKGGPREYIIFSFLSGALCTGAYYLSGQAPIGMIAVALIGFLGLPRFVLNYKIKKRLNKFTGLFPDAIDIIVRGVKSGLPIGECLNIIGRETPEPIGSEMRLVTEGIKLGMTMNDAMQRMGDRLPSQEFRFFTIVLATQQTTGGNLAETLAKLSEILRARKKMREKVKAMSSEAKASAGIIGSLPIVVCALLSFIAPQYVGLLFTTTAGNFMLGLGVCIMATGIMVMRKMINFDM